MKHSPSSYLYKYIFRRTWKGGREEGRSAGFRWGFPRTNKAEERGSGPDAEDHSDTWLFPERRLEAAFPLLKGERVDGPGVWRGAGSKGTRRRCHGGLHAGLGLGPVTPLLIRPLPSPTFPGRLGGRAAAASARGLQAERGCCQRPGRLGN